MVDMHARTIEVNDATDAAWNAHNPDAVAAVFAEDAVTRDAGLTTERGRVAVRERAARLLAAFPDLRLDRIDLVVDGDRHADRWTLSGTHEGELLGIPPTGRRVTMHGATFSRMNADGLVAENTHYVDVAGLLDQLGVI